MIIKQDKEYKANGKRFYVNYKNDDYVCIIKPSESNMNTVYREKDNKILWGNEFTEDNDLNDGWEILKGCMDIYWK